MKEALEKPKIDLAELRRAQERPRPGKVQTDQLVRLLTTRTRTERREERARFLRARERKREMDSKRHRAMNVAAGPSSSKGGREQRGTRGRVKERETEIPSDDAGGQDDDGREDRDEEEPAEGEVQWRRGKETR